MEDIILKYGHLTLEELNSDELQHHGIKGMKWGRRRYQNKDGSLTPAGEKRYYTGEKKRLEKQKAKVAAAGARKAEVDKLRQDIEDMKSGKSTSADKPKTVKDMSDDELRKEKARLDLERDYQRSYEQANPQEASKYENLQPKNVVKDIISKSVLPAVQESGKKLIADYMLDQGKKILGLEKDPSPGSIEALKKSFEKIDYEGRIAGAKALKIAYENALKNPDSIVIKNKDGKASIDVDRSMSKKDNESDKTNNSEPDYENSAKRAHAKRNRPWKRNDDYEEDSVTVEWDFDNDWTTTTVSGTPAKTSSNGKKTVSDIIDANKGLTWAEIQQMNRNEEAERQSEEWYKHLSHSDITLDDIEAIVHHGIKGQKWGVRRYQNKNGSLTAEGKEHRDKREGRNNYRVKDKIAAGSKGESVNKELPFKKLRKFDIENGYVDKNGSGNCTEKGHVFEKEKRSKMTIEEQTAELKKLNEYWNGEFFNGERAYKSTKLNTEITNFILDKHDNDNGNIKSHAEKVKVAYDNYRKAFRDYGSKNGINSVFTKQGRNDLEPYKKEIDSAVLSDLGYADTPEARTYIRDFWGYD